MSGGISPERERLVRKLVRARLSTWCEYALRDYEQEPAPHHRAIIEALERLERGESRQLMLLLPPGSAKSTYATLLFPPWFLARNARCAVITASHTASLAEHFGRGVRGLLLQHAPRLRLQVRQDSRAAGRFLTDLGGEYFAIGVHGAVTGRRADLALIDDPVPSFAAAESLAARDRLWNWFRAELLTRLKPGARVVLIMTRWHADDLAGRLIEQGGWQVLRFPALAELGDPLGRAPGAALWPAWEDRAELLRKREMLGERAFAALFQQAPQREFGSIFDVGKITLLDAVPEGFAVRAWDLAATADGSGDPDWTVGVRLLRDGQGGLVVEDVVRVRGGPAEIADLVRSIAESDGERVPIGLPRDPGQAGVSQILFLTRNLIGYRVTSSPEKESKPLRAAAVASQVSAGNLRLRRGMWNAAFVEELAAFPNGRKDDQVDALARAFAMLVERSAPARYATIPFAGR